MSCHTMVRAKSSLPGIVVSTMTQSLSPNIADNSSHVPTSFPLFPRLPVELQFEIWKHADDSEKWREICIINDTVVATRRQGGRKVNLYDYKISVVAKPPAMSLTCENARAVFLSRTTCVTFCTRGGLTKVAVDLERDTLFFADLAAFRSFCASYQNQPASVQESLIKLQHNLRHIKLGWDSSYRKYMKP